MLLRCRLQWAKGDLNPHPLAGTWPSTMRVCLFRHSPLLTPSTSEQPFSLVAQDLLLLLKSPTTPQMADPATGGNTVEPHFGSGSGSAICPVAVNYLGRLPHWLWGILQFYRREPQ